MVSVRCVRNSRSSAAASAGSSSGIHTIGRSFGSMAGFLSSFRRFFTGTGFRIASGAFLGFFEAIAFPLEIQQFGFMHESIDESDDAAGIREDLGPFAERLVRRDNDGIALVAASDDLEEQVRVARVIGQISDLIDPEDCWAGVATQAARER